MEPFLGGKDPILCRQRTTHVSSKSSFFAFQKENARFFVTIARGAHGGTGHLSMKERDIKSTPPALTKWLLEQIRSANSYTPISVTRSDPPRSITQWVKNNGNRHPGQKPKIFENPGKVWLFKSAILQKPRQKLLIFYSPRWQKLAGFLDLSD